MNMNVKFNPTADGQAVDIILDDKVIATEKIFQDDNKQLYIHVPNLYHLDRSISTRKSFQHRPGEMVQAIRDGWGDCIKVSNLIVRDESLVHFLDRKYGEELRAKSLDGWKNTKFSWAVFVRSTIYDGAPLTVNGDFSPTDYNCDARRYQTQYYESEQEAQAFIDSIVNELKPKLDAYNALEETEEKDRYYEQNLKDYAGVREFIILICANSDQNIPLYAGQVIRKDPSSYRKIKVYCPENNTTEGYMCPGEAHDKETCSYSVRGGIEEKTLYIQNPSALFADGDTETIFSVKTVDGSTDYYYTLQEALESKQFYDILPLIEKADYASVEKMELHKQELFPIVPSDENPIEIFAEEGERGLIAWENMNPEQVGKYSPRKKALFPDKSCVGKLCAGKVRVTKVKDMGNYGFFTGEMVRYETPDEQKLAEYLLDHNRENDVLTFIRNPYWGSAVIIKSKSDSEIYYVKGKDGEVQYDGLLLVYDHEFDEKVEQITARDFLCSGYAGMNFSELCGIVTPVSAGPFARVEKSLRFVNKDFDEAIRIGVIEIYRVKSMDFCVVNPKRMCEAASCLQDRLVTVLKKADEINLRALANTKKK